MHASQQGEKIYDVDKMISNITQNKGQDNPILKITYHAMRTFVFIFCKE